jgi:outer membrane usher protein FimD/PapC
MEALNFSFSFGPRGKMNFLVGAEYISRKSNGVTEQGLNPRADVNMNYRLFQRWTFDASARISEMYNITEHSGNANLNFRAGKTTFLIGYQYNKSQVDSVLSAISNERSVFKMQLTREF